ncbi:hypothetical protein [Actinoplanes sp. NPDC048796]|uniref:SWIM zinc finger family protein n=1 Tax=Actinoplanes sp. NPDC048796 TaxID=3155640 RepID=UPI0033D77F68
MSDERLSLAFLGTFESLRMGPTFARGRRDERAGHVRSLTISGSLVVALVRGPDDPRAFRARIAVRAFGASEWARVEEDLVREARFAADLLAGRMPPGIGQVFQAAGLSLVPLSLDEVAMDCTCERWPMPCVHLAATSYALARSFEEDPFGAFTWRGRGRDELLLRLRELRSARAVTGDPAASAGGLGVPAGGQGASAGAMGAFAGGQGASTGGQGASAGGMGASAGARAASGGGMGASADFGASGAVVDDAVPDLGDQLGDAADFWGSGLGEPAVPTGGRPGAVTRPDALLDQLDPPGLAHDGRPIVDVLRPAYLALPET